MSSVPAVKLSNVEKKALGKTPFMPKYPPSEKIKSIVVDTFPQLGRLASLRFIEWIIKNPEGVISLPTGKTPEFFIKWVKHFLTNWSDKPVREILEEYGIDHAKRPDTQGLSFVQIDEFYPIHPEQHNSFYHYVNHYYINGFGLDPEKALLINCNEIGLEPGETLESVWQDSDIDLSLRVRQPVSRVESRRKELISRIDMWCMEYESKIRDLGGIGFFLGGIGPDGHIGFNVSGSDHFSSTRLTETNYETQAAAATDLGGIEIARKRPVITIGLGTITENRDCTAIIIAAGAAKSGIVASAVTNEPSNLYPATALHKLENAAFYLTRGAALGLEEHELELIRNEKQPDNEILDRIIIDLSLRQGERLKDLTKKDFLNDKRLQAGFLTDASDTLEIEERVIRNLEAKIERGMRSLTEARFLHTEPHHDDLLLGCLPYIVRNIRSVSNRHYFITLTSGFTAVANHYIEKIITELTEFLNTDQFQILFEAGYFEPENSIARNRDLWHFLDGIASKSDSVKREGLSRRFIRNMIETYNIKSPDDIHSEVDNLLNYFSEAYPGKKDREDIQKLKGMCREWEAECLWGYFGWDCSFIHHPRLGFYTGDIFTEEPTYERDIAPVIDLLHTAKPDIVTVALDPEASGPDTHYKVLQAVTAALTQYSEQSGKKDIRIWGYRNIWYRFHPAEADIAVPVSLNMFSIMHSAFMDTFASQRDASFPSHEHDGPFSELAQKIQVEQYQMLKTCLGRGWFHEHPSPLIRATRGIVFLKELTLEELTNYSTELRQATENR